MFVSILSNSHPHSPHPQPQKLRKNAGMLNALNRYVALLFTLGNEKC